MALQPTWGGEPLEARTGSPGRDDGDLVRRAQGGEEAARDELARRSRRSAYSLALQLLGDPEDALDVAQDALMRFFAHLGRLDPERPWRPWLLAIVRNRCRDLLRRHRGRSEQPLEAAPAERIVDPGPGPAASLEHQELRLAVWRALGELSEAQREILVLRDYQDLTYEEIARVLGVPMGTVMSRLHRARKALAGRLTSKPTHTDPKTP